MKLKFSIFILSIFTSIFIVPKAQAQITPTPNDANTIVNQTGNTFTITGGTQVDKNLFHSLQKFGLNENQIADFVTNPGTQNVLGRITGGDASVINGLIKITGSDANLYLMNPAGIIFGSGAKLDVPGSFTATTANGIGFGDNKWFNGFGDNNYAELMGEPNSFAFTMSEPGAIFNAGNLAVAKGESLNLLGGITINTGTLSSEGGNINVAAIPGQKLVRITQEGSLLSLGLPTSTANNLNPVSFNPLSLPQLLTGGNLNSATGITVENGIVKLTGSGVEIPNQSGTAIVSNKINTSGNVGGNVNILGEKVGVVSANINATGKNGGGTVLIGGDYKGEGIVPNAKITFISQDSVVKADAEDRGNGGKVIAWADQTTGFYGTISARGGNTSGDGGFVEVSGKENLIFRGQVDTSAINGNLGSLLLDPASIYIVDGNTGANDAAVSGGGIFSDETDDDGIFTISETVLESLIGSLTLEASERIILEDLSDDKLNLSNVSSVKFITGNQGSSGSFRMIDGNDTIQTVGGGINISARFIDIGNLASNGGNIEITTPSNGNLRLEEDAFIQSMGGDININADITTSILSPKALTLEAGSGNVNIQGNIGSQSTKINQLNITGNDILIDGQFSQRFFTKEDLTLEAQGNLGLSFGTEFTAGGNLNLTAQGDLKLNNVNLTAEQALVLQTPRVLETTSSSNLQAGTNLSLETNSLLFPSFANLSLKAGQNLNVLVEQDLPLSRFSLNAGGNLLLRSQLGNIISNGKIFPQDNLQGDVILEADQDITITNSRLEASRDLKLQAGRDINVEKSQLLAGRDANIIAASQVEIQDDAKSSDEAAIITAQRDLLIQGDSSINIQAFRNPTSIIESGNNLTLISDGLITGNVNFVSGGNFATISVGGGVGNFQQTIIPNFDTIISSGGDVNFGNYEGLALKVEAKGSITGGDININGPNPTLAGSDPDISLLTNGPGLVLRAGVEQLKNTPNISNQTVGGTNFTSPGQSSSANITVGNINTAIGGQGGSVTMSTTGNIKIGNIRTAGDKSDITTVPGFVDLQAMGDIEVKTINTSGSDGGDINIIAGRLFRATDSFLQPDFVDSNTNANGVDGEKVLGEIPTSIYATGVSQGGANISIKHGGRSFLIGPKFERDANGNLVFRDNIGNLLPYTVDESGRVRDADNNILTNIVIGTPIDKANIPVFTSFTAGAITSNQENAGLVTSFRDSPLESRDTNTFSVGGGRVQVTFDPQAIPSDEVVQRQLNQDDKNTICPPQTTVAFNQGKNTRGGQTTTISQPQNKDTCTTVNKENILKIAQ